MNSNRTPLRTAIDGAWSLFLKGLLTLLPIALTLAIFNVSFKILKRWLAPLSHIQPPFITGLPFSEVIVALVVIFLVGIILDVFLLHWLVHAFEKLISRIPLVRPIYAGIKQLVHAFNPQDKISFKQVVLVEFPRKGIYSLGFLTSQLPSDLLKDGDHTYFSVFVPTTPNPTTGFFLVVAPEHFTLVNLSRQEAMALIISGGIIQPERFTQKQEQP